MRILTVTHFFEAHGGGIERVAGHLCRQFAGQGHQPVWAASGHDISGEEADRIEIVKLRCFDPLERMTGLPMPLPGWAAVRALFSTTQSADGVIIHDALYATSILAMVFAKFHRKPTVLIQHIAGIPFSNGLMRTIMRLSNFLVTGAMMRAADRLLFISDSVRRDLIGEKSRLPYSLVFNGVDRRHFFMDEVKDRLSPGHPTILFVGRYVEKKGLSVLRELARARPEIRLQMVGSGPIKPTDWELNNVVDLGPQTSEQLGDLYRSADLLLLPSVGEGFPLVIQEAMACGLPVVCGAQSASADPGASRWLTGVEIKLSDPKGAALACSDAIDRTKMSQDERSAMAAYAVDTYSWQTMAATIGSLLKESSSKDLR